MSTIPPTDPPPTLVLRAQAGDLRAFDDVLRLSQVRLHRHVLRICGDPALAEDVVQCVFLSLHRSLPWLRDPHLYWPWAFRMANRAAIRAVTQERRRHAHHVDDFALDTLPDLTAWQPDPLPRGWPIEEWIARLSPASRVVISLHYLEEMTLAEIAAIEGIPEGTVKSRLAYGLTALRTFGRTP